MDVVVIGSANMDLVVKAKEIPKIGETLLGEELLQIPGGKGANQSVAIAKIGKDIGVTFLGKVGNDPFGEELLKSMMNAGVNTQYVEKTEGPTGIAVINVDSHGNNNIVVIQGANSKVDMEYVEGNINVIKNAKIALLQLEIPMDTVKNTLRLSKKLGVRTILNPAPAHELDDELIGDIDILILNEHELERISKMKIEDEKSILEGAEELLRKGTKEIIVTLGEKGAVHVNEKGYKHYNPYKVNVVDTTAAGDSFIGGFITSYIKDGDIDKAIDIGQKSAALAIQKTGAQSSIPTMEEVVKTNFVMKQGV